VLDALPDPTATLIITGSRNILGESRWQALWQWLEDGGQLITNAQAFTDPETGRSHDELLNRLGLHLYEVSQPQDELPDSRQALRNWLQFATEFDSEACPSPDHIITLPVEGEDTPLQIAIHPGLVLEDHSAEAVASADNEDGIQLIQYAVGHGSVTVVSDISLWSNGKMACYDHAYLLDYLAASSSGAWIIYNVEMPSLWSLLWRKAPLVLSLSGLLLVLWVWRYSLRFGPLILPAPAQRRRLMEHIRAGGMYHWRQGYHGAQVEDLQQSIISAMHYRYQGFRHLDETERCALIAKVSRFDATEVQWALNCKQCANQDAFVRLIQVLQAIRNKI
jgi:hypothetical protein